MERARKTYVSLRAYASYVGTFKLAFWGVIALTAISNISLAVIPIFIGELVGALASSPMQSSEIYFFSGVLIICSFGHHIVWMIADFSYLKLINRRSFEFENIVFASVIEKQYSYFTTKFTGKIGSYIESLGREFREFMQTVCFSYIGQIIRLPTIAVIMFVVNVWTGIAFVLTIVLMLGLGKIMVRKLIDTEKAETDAVSDVSGYTIDVVSNFVNVKAFRKERAETRHIRLKREHAITKANSAYWANVVFWGGLGVVIRMIAWPLIIVLNVYLFMQGHISLVEMTTFLSAIVIFSDFIWEVVWEVSRFSVRLARIEESYRYLFDDRNIVKEYRQNSSLGEDKVVNFASALTVRELSFAYPDEPDSTVLNGIDFTLKKGEKVGIVGGSGGGKTTLVKLLLGYYALPTSVVLMDGKPTDNRLLVHHISYVPQDTALFHRSIAENIAYCVDSVVSQTKIEEAARRAYAHEFITAHPEGYEVVVGERGIKLSMGQRQRVAIARAFLDDKPILILDEATSALDSESEMLVQQALEDLWADKTVIAIAHRLSTLRHMDRILVMDQGKIVEQGTHQELLKLKGRYLNLWRHQSQGMIVDETD